MSSPLAAGGLILDIAGALALASAFAFKRPGDIAAEAGTYWDFNAPLLLSIAKQTADAWVGAALLMLGFAGQFDSALGSHSLSFSVTVPLAIAIDLVALAGLYRGLRPWNVRRLIESLLAGQDVAKWHTSIIWLSRAQGREIEDGEPPQDLGRWLLGSTRWERLTAVHDLSPELTEPYQRAKG